MTSRVSHTTIDCHDAFALSEWWKGVLDYVDIEGDPNLPGHEECMILSRDGSHRLLFIEVPDWDGLAITYVQDKRDWRTGDRMKVKFARMRPDYTLEFDGPRGPHRNKFGRRN